MLTCNYMRASPMDSPCSRAPFPLAPLFAQALGDDDETVAAAMVASGREIIEKQPEPPDMVSMLSPPL